MNYKAFVCIVMIFLVVILFLRKVSGKKGTWDNSENIKEYAFLVGPSVTLENPKSKNLETRLITNTHKEDVKIKVDDKSSMGERICRKYLERKLNTKFDRIRPAFLKNPVTGMNLELDCYSPELNLALEYNGIQHYDFVQKFHKNRSDFHNQQYRDMMKQKMCYNNGIDLIIVPYTVPHKNIPDYIDKALEKLKR